MEESTSPAASLRHQLVGQRIGSYRVIEPLGSGGMSTVLRAEHLETGHEVALKVLLGTLERNSNLLQRFLREARVAESLEHPNIVSIFDRGVDQGRHYLVLEYVPGGDFHDYVQRRGPLDIGEAILVIRGVASGLRYAAGRGLIHRDIKPSNVLRTPAGDAKIIDLGLALQSEFEDERVTREGTTVGTVDYMAPEQARDSRATNIQSDMYSLGCTFYYLLAGIPPYPGGDITEKLTRHARAAAPDIRDLRPDIPAPAALILLRMMAKQPEDRFADYDQLIAALDAVGKPGEGDGDAIALAPLDPSEADDQEIKRVEGGAGRPAHGGPAPRNTPDSEALQVESLDGFSLELADEREQGERRPSRGPTEAPFPRMGRSALASDSDEAIEEEAAEGTLPVRASQPFPSWILATAAIAMGAVVLVVGLHLILGGPGPADPARVEIPDPGRDSRQLLVNNRTRRPPAAPVVSPVDRVSARKRHPEPVHSPSPVRPRPPWVEPDDVEPVAGVTGPIPAEIQQLRQYLPEWTRAPSTVRSDDALVVVRRVADVADGPTEPTLHLALDRHIGGTVELADVGPLTPDDLRMSGESRVIRPRRGFRPVIRVLRSRVSAARDQTAFLPLDRKSLTLEGIDFIVDARDLSGKQQALFGCTGSSLTIRDCTITVINPTGSPFTLVRQEPSPARPQESAPRPSRIWIERSLIRGDFVTVADLTGGPADLVLDETAVIVGGVRPPIVRVSSVEAVDERRILIAGSLLACPGPVIQCDQKPGAPTRTKPLAVRAYGSAFGRLQGPGIASIITAVDPRAVARHQVDWVGARNLYAGWRGFFARGPEPTITVDDLAQVRSTWNATEQGSQEALAFWPLSGDPVRLVAADMDPFLDSGRESLMTRPARPSPGLFPKTIEAYVAPFVPEVAASALASPNAPAAMVPRTNRGMTPGSPQGPDAFRTQPGPEVVGGVAGSGPIGPGSATAMELTMSTADPQWSGDLGAFLRQNVPATARHVRVRVAGSGSHRFTPVRLPDGVALEIQVTPTGPEPLSWSPDPAATGPGLIELHGGALALANVVLRHDPQSKLENLLSLDDSHLVLFRCQLTVPPDSGGPAGDLISFRAPTTRPVWNHPGNLMFRDPVDRPVCRLIDTVLIANRTALKAEVGRGLVALSHCAVASDDTVLELDPGRVARRAFAADLWLDHCTLVSARSIVRLGPWRGVAAGPDRPWLISSRNCAFLTLSDARSHDATLLRVDADAFAGGCLFWQADGDAHEVDRVVSASETSGAAVRRKDQWDLFWASNRATQTVLGPAVAGLRLRDRPRPGHIEPRNLILETPLTQGRRLDVGANPAGPGYSPGPSPAPSAAHPH